MGFVSYEFNRSGSCAALFRLGKYVWFDILELPYFNHPGMDDRGETCHSHYDFLFAVERYSKTLTLARSMASQSVGAAHLLSSVCQPRAIAERLFALVAGGPFRRGDSPARLRAVFHGGHCSDCLGVSSEA